MSYEAFFKEADTDGSNYLTYKELSTILRAKGYKGCEGELQKIFDTADTGDDNKISFDEYMAAMATVPDKDHKVSQMRGVFRSFDLDNSGLIDKEEMKNVFKEMGRILTEDEAQRMIALCDQDCSGTVNYEEFVERIFNQ